MSETSIPKPTELIAERIKADSSPGARADSYKIAQIFQGGAMRVGLTAGAAMAERAIFGRSKPIDRFDGTSSGVPPWIYLLAGSREAEGCSIPYDELSQGFLGLRNIIKKRKAVDLELMMAAFRSGKKRMDFDQILSHPTETHVYATSINDAEVVDFRIGQQALDEEQGLHHQEDEYVYFCHSPSDVCKAIEASAHIPVYAGRPVAITDTVACVDGGVSAAGRVPLRRAIASGATHILVFWTDKTTESGYPKSQKEKFAAWWLKRHHPELAANYWAGHSEHLATIDLIAQTEKSQQGLPLIEVIRVPDNQIPSSQETRPDIIYLSSLAGRAAVLKVFEPYGLPIDENIRLLSPESLRTQKLG